MINSRIKPQPWVNGRISLIDSSYISITVWTIGEKSRGILENSWVIFSIRVGSSWRINLNDDSLLLSDPENNCRLHCDLVILQENSRKVYLSFRTLKFRTIFRTAQNFIDISMNHLFFRRGTATAVPVCNKNVTAWRSRVKDQINEFFKSKAATL